MRSIAKIGAVLVASSLTFAGFAQAQDGYVGLSFGDFTKDDPENGQFHGRSSMIEGLFHKQFGAGALVVEGSHRSDNINSEALWGSEMTTQSHIAVHYVRNFGSAATVSGFLGYGVAPHATARHDISVAYGGIGGSFAVSPTFTTYGQLGIGDAPNEGTTIGLGGSSGFAEGEFIRLGVTYTGLQRTTLAFEYERAFSDRYEDADPAEPGSFGSIYLGGTTSMTANQNFQVTYGARSAFFDAQGGDFNRAEEVTASLGIRYVFGGNSTMGDYARKGVLGSPYLPLRASNWTPALD